MKVKKLLNILALLIVINFNSLSAEVKVLFHPYDSTFDEVVKYLEQADSTIDIAMYNLEVSDRSKIIKFFKSPVIQERILASDLKVRLIYEGYGTTEAKEEKSFALESLGIDVRWLASGKKMHHKFAVIDGYTKTPSLITGSANWSLSSRNNYNENILFFKDEVEIAWSFQTQFELLWNASNEFGSPLTEGYFPFNQPLSEPQDLAVFFNTDNFNIRGLSIRNKRQGPGYTLTRQLVKAIDQAENNIKIASTRIKLRPIYNALLRAASRVVKVDIVVTMGEYDYRYKRNRMKMKVCESEFQRQCSSSHNFAHFLSLKNFEGHENVKVRLKFFNINLNAYLQKQMHSKYIIIDDRHIYTGSFNWSYSAEYSHIENLVYFDGIQFADALTSFQRDFDFLFNMNRNR